MSHALHPELAAGPRTPLLQRAQGAGRIDVALADGRTRLSGLFQDGCAKIRMPIDHAARDLEAVLINTAGGVTGGDRMSWQARAQDGARLTLTTPACEKVYRAQPDAAPGDVAVSLTVGREAQVCWLPQETILFNRSALARSFTADLQEGGRLLVAEAVLLGRIAMGETLQQASFRDRWRIRREGRLVFADDLRVEGRVEDTTALACSLAGAGAFASVLLVSDAAEGLLGRARDVIGASGGASAFDGQLFARIVTPDGLALRTVLLPLIALLRSGAPVPRVWGI